MSAIKKEDASMTSEEMLDRSASWTLACDNALLNRLKRFSEDLTKNSQDILRECDALSNDVKKLDYGLINVSNEFHMLSNTQFVENRVEDFEEFSSSISSSNATTTVKTKAEQEAALVSKMKQAIQLGLAACNERRCSSGTSPADRFKMKQPYIIGSPKFFSSKYCGLVDESRRQTSIYQDPIDLDSVSIGQSSDVSVSSPVQPKPEIKFTMPPTSVFPIKVPDQKPMFSNDNHIIQNEERKSFGVPPSPTISTRSSELGGGSVSSISRDNMMPRAVTDELNKIYGSFAPPPAVDDDSDDDFRPSAGVGRIFEDDDDDIFDEKELFPSSQKKPDFFGRSNPSQHSQPIFTVPPPVNPVPQSNPTSSSMQASVGQEPKTNDTPNMNSVTDDISKKDVAIRGPPPETGGPFRAKLPPGAVSLFGNLPPPVFNNGTLQEAQTTNTDIAPNTSKPDTQISSNPSAGVSNVFARSAPFSGVNRNITTASSHLREDVNQEYATSQPSQSNAIAPGRTENIRQGSLSSSGDTRSNVKPKQNLPVSSLFADESSDEDIFSSSKKPRTVDANMNQSQKVVHTIHSPILSSSLNNNKVPSQVPTRSSNPVKKPAPVKKSIFDDSESEDDLFSSRNPTTRSQSKPVSDNGIIFKSEPKKLSAPVNKRTSLFSDDSDSDSDLFGNKSTVQAKPIMASSVGPAKMEESLDKLTVQDEIRKISIAPIVEKIDSSSVVNESNDVNHEKPSASSHEKFGGVDELVGILKARVKIQRKRRPPTRNFLKSLAMQDKETEKEDEKSPDKELDEEGPPHETKGPFRPKLPPGAVSLFGNLPPPVFKNGTLQAAQVKKTDSAPSTVDSNMNHPQKIFNTINTSIVSSSLNNKVPSQVPTRSSNPVKKPAPVKKSIFDDSESEDDLFSSKNPSTRSLDKPVSDNGIISKSEPEPKKLSAPVNKRTSLFSDDSDSDSDLFGNKSTVQAKPKIASSVGLAKMEESLDKLTVQDVIKKISIAPIVEKIDSSSVVNESNDVSHEKPSASSHEKYGGVGELVGILKARVKIQRKRRPPTRNFLKSLAMQDKETEKEDEKSPDKELNEEGESDIDNEVEANDAVGVDKEIEESD